MMAVVDGRGRLFGKVNLIDFAVLLFVVALVPLGYGAYLLFRTQPPRLLSVEPAIVPYLKGAEQKVQVTGEHLRPFLRAKLDTLEAKTYTLQSARTADISFEAIPPGTYDVVLLDEGQEVSRLPKALTIAPPPIQAVGTFAPSPETAALAPGATFAHGGETRAVVVAIDPAAPDGGRRGIVRVTCRLGSDNGCLLDGTAVKAGSDLALAPAGRAAVRFHVDDLRVDAEWLRVKVRLMGLPDLIQQAHVGDVDEYAGGNPREAVSPIAGVKTGAILASVGELQKGQGTFSVTSARPQAGPSDLSAYGVLSATLPADAELADLLVPVDKTPAGFKYRDIPVRPGNILPFETANYRLQALVLGIAPANP